ncbi:hypothetical protein KKF91_04710, partial [Myxococcota bacterium]|nr:hypothetical protein [Myxococcota bacterium]
IDARAWPDGDLLILRYTIQGASWPAAARLGPQGEALWRSTCFELFIAQAQGAAYIEWNLDPAGRYRVYLFSGPRARVEGAEARAASLCPRGFTSRPTPGGQIIEVTLPLHAIGEALGDAPWRAQPTAIIEGPAGLSYFAPAHPGPQPDFHRFDHLSPLDLTQSAKPDSTSNA